MNPCICSKTANNDGLTILLLIFFIITLFFIIITIISNFFLNIKNNKGIVNNNVTINH